MRRVVVALTTAGVLAAGLMAGPPAQAAVATPAATTPDFQPAPATFGPCPAGAVGSPAAECAMVSVPLDYAAPQGKKIQIAVSRISHTVPDAQFQGVMLANPGGPGGSGLGLSVLGGRVPGGAGQTYDWIGFDPRGVGRSVPALMR